MERKNQIKIQSLLKEVMRIENANMGAIRGYQPQTDELIIIESYGFTCDFVKHFEKVKPFDSSSCGRAFGIGNPVIISDLEQDASFRRSSGSLWKALSFNAVKSVPIITPGGKKLGIISTYFRDAKWNWESDKLESILPDLANAILLAYQK